MARKYLTPIDLNKLELQNARIQNLATPPSSPTVGQIYFDTVDKVIKTWDGTAWINSSQGVQGLQGIGTILHPYCLLQTNFCLWNIEFSNLTPVFQIVVAGTICSTNLIQ